MKSVLICEDDLGRMEAMVLAFSRAGYTARVARHPEHAVRQLRETPCDAVLCAADLREGNPLQLVEGVRTLGVDAPIFMVVQGADESLRESLRERGVRHLLDASSSPREWVQLVEKALRERPRTSPGPAVLVHSTDPEFRRSLTEAVEALGLHVLEACDALEARALMRARRPSPDLAVVDLDDGGSSLIEDLRGAAPGLYVAAVTRQPQRARLRSAYDAGAATVVSSSCPPSRLAGLLAANLEQARRDRRSAMRPRAAASSPARSDGFSFLRRPWRGVSAVLLSASFLAGALLAAVYSAAPSERPEASLTRPYVLVPADFVPASGLSPAEGRPGR